MSAIFLDKDGTLLDNVPYNTDPRLMRWAPGAEAGVRLLARMGVPLFVVSNQPGLALGRFQATQLASMAQHLQRMFGDCGAALAGCYFCPHAPESATGEAVCRCRKPQPGLLLQAAAEHGLDLSHCWMVGDILDDIEAGRRAGCGTVLIDNGNETLWHLTPLRRPDHAVGRMDQAAELIANAMRRMPAAQRVCP
jgi:histidinol-phosphate phosphatase family protein